MDASKSSCMGSHCISVLGNYLPEGLCVTHIWLSWNHYISLYQTMRRTIAHLLFNTSICWFSEWITNIFSRSAIIHVVSIKCQEEESDGMYYAVVYYVLCCGVIKKILKIDNVYQHIWIWIRWLLLAVVRMLKYIRSQIIAGITLGRVLQEELYTHNSDFLSAFIYRAVS